MTEENRLIIEPYLKSYPKVSLIVSLSTLDKNEVVRFIADKLSLPLVDITDSVDYSFLNNLYLQPEPTIYLINLDSLTIPKQNSILKFVEECPTNAYVVLTSSNKSQIISTIMTRSIMFELHKYSKVEIVDTINSMDVDESVKNLLISICVTRDDIEDFNKFDLVSLYSLCNKIISSMGSATLPNTLSIKDKYIYFSDYEPGKFSLDVFTSMLSYCLLSSFKDTRSKIVYYLYVTVLNFKDKLLNKTLSREFLLDNLLIKLWKVSRGELV